MCGIVGIRGNTERLLLESMARNLTHRGPDDEGYWIGEGVGLGMRRLSIVDLNSGQQPIHNEDKSLWIVCNGEIYNHVLIRETLQKRGHRFYTDHCDIEVILHLYEEYGELWPHHVNGMFGAAIWDANQKRLSLYRDRIGKKPLYYARSGNELLFASEIKALLGHPGVSKELDYEALGLYFAHKNISAPRTAYRQIRQLLPGHYLVFDNGNLRTEAYWRLDFENVIDDISEKEAAEHLLRLLTEAVEMRTRCDVPFGAYLSGGVDSSAVAALVARSQDKPVETFCLGYDEEGGQFAGKTSDLEHARDMARRLGSHHHEWILSAKAFAEGLPGVLAAFDEPFSGTISTYYLSELIRKHVKVALSGDGADELFGSYLTHRMAFPVENAAKLIKKGRQDLRNLTDEERESLAPFDSEGQFAFLKRFVELNAREQKGALVVFNAEERANLLAPELFYMMEKTSDLSVFPERLDAKDVLNRALELDQNELLPNQVLPFVDRLSMAHSVEVRVPFMDYRIIEFANRLPGKMKIQGRTTKFILRKALSELLPSEILNRPKEGFVQPIYSWMHGSLKAWTLNELSMLPEAWFRREAVRILAKKLEMGDSSVNAKVWNLICFGVWWREVART